jgi:hypothetical protein
MTMVTVELLVGGLIVAFVAMLALLAWATGRRHEPPSPITEAQARENAAPLTTAILASGRRERTDL